MGLLGDIIGGITGAVDTGYSIWQDKRDYDYQKALQQTMFEREDNAVQRRMADLQAAGLNPNLAGGSAASAGAVVSRSNSHDVNFGAALDSIQAINQIRQQREQTELLKQEHENAIKTGKILSQNYDKNDMENKYTEAKILSELGIPYGINSFNAFGAKNWGITLQDGAFYSNKSRMSDVFSFQDKYLKNSADMLNKQLNDYEMDRILKNISLFMPDIYAGVNVGKKLK